MLEDAALGNGHIQGGSPKIDNEKQVNYASFVRSVFIKSEA